VVFSCYNVLSARDYEETQSPSISVVANKRKLNTLASCSGWLMWMAEPAADTLLCCIHVSLRNSSPDPHLLVTLLGASVGAHGVNVRLNPTFLSSQNGICRSPWCERAVKSYISFFPEWHL